MLLQLFCQRSSGTNDDLWRTCPSPFTLLKTGLGVGVSAISLLDPFNFLPEEREPNVNDDGECNVLFCMLGVASDDKEGEIVMMVMRQLAFFAGLRGWNAGGGSTSGAGVNVCLCVMLNADDEAGGIGSLLIGFRVSFGGELAQSTVGQGAICCPIREEAVPAVDMPRARLRSLNARER